MNKDNPPLVSLHQGDYEENWWTRAVPDKRTVLLMLGMAAAGPIVFGLLLWSGL